MLRPAKVTASASGRSPEPSQTGHSTLSTNLQHPTAHHRALRVGQRVPDVALGAGERAVVVVVGGDRMLARIDLDGRLLVGEQDPVAMPLGQFAPRLVDVVAERDEDVAQVLPLPGAGPCGDGALADGQRRVGNQVSSVTWWIRPSPWHSGQAPTAVFGENASESSRSVKPRRKRARPGEEHPQQIRQRRDGAHRRPRRRRPAPLLQCDGGRQPRDVVDLRRAGRQQQAAGVRRDRLEVAALRLGVDGPEGQRRLARPRDAGERDQRVARGGDVDSRAGCAPGCRRPGRTGRCSALRGSEVCWHAGRRRDSRAMRLRPESSTCRRPT